ncbi:MAG: septum formation initiator family protein [Anaerovorax sp.]
MIKQKKKRSRQFRDERKVCKTEVSKRKRRVVKAQGQEVKPSKSAVSKRRASKTAKRKLIYTTIILGIIVVVGVSGFNVYNVINEEKQVKQEQAQLLKEKQRLEYQLQQIDSLEYIEQQARQLLRMTKPGEILYVLPDPKDVEAQGGQEPKPEEEGR